MTCSNTHPSTIFLMSNTLTQEHTTFAGLIVETHPYNKVMFMGVNKLVTND
jgi:hypothetical protein